MIEMKKIKFVNGETPINDTNLNAMQDNAEKAINDVDAKVIALDERTEDAEENITNLQSEDIELKEFIESNLKDMTAEGTNINVQDSANFYAELTVDGKANQVQTTQSSNLADVNVLYKEMQAFNSTYVSEEVADNKECIKLHTAHYLTSKGFEGLKNIGYKENTVYTVRLLARVYDTTIVEGASLWVQFAYTDGTTSGTSHYAAGETWQEFRCVSNAGKTVACIGFSYGASTWWLVDKDSFGIYEGDVTEYSAFIPDSPSPDYPSEIEVVEGYENLMPFSEDKTFTLAGVEFTCENGELILNGTSTGEILTSNEIYKSNFNFTLKAGTYAFYHESDLGLNMAININKTSDNTAVAINNLNSNTKKTFTITEDTEVYLGMYIYQKIFENAKIKLMLVEGEIKHRYVPCFKQAIEIISKGKNLIPFPYYATSKSENGLTFTVNNDGTILINGTATANEMFVVYDGKGEIPLTKQTYTLSGINDGKGGINTYYFQMYVNDVNQGTNASGPLVKTYTEDGLFVTRLVFFYKTGAVFNNFLFAPQLQVGATATAYEPYKEDIRTIDLQENFMAKIPNGEKDSLNINKIGSIKLAKNVSKIVADDNLSVSKNTSYGYFEVTLTNKSTSYAAFMSNLFSSKDARIGTTGNLWIFYTDTEFAEYTAAEMKQWLIDNTFELYYKLSEPYQVDLGTLETPLKTFRTVTNISNSANTNMLLNYKKDLQTQIAEIEALLSTSANEEVTE